MLQRIQSIYLLLAGTGDFCPVPVSHWLITFISGGVFVDHLGYRRLPGCERRTGACTNFYIAPDSGNAAIVGLLLCSCSIFLYKNRKQQIMYCYLYIVTDRGSTVFGWCKL